MTIEYLSVRLYANNPPMLLPALIELLRDAAWVRTFPKLRYLSFGHGDSMCFNHQMQSEPLYEETIGDWVQEEMKQPAARACA